MGSNKGKRYTDDFKHGAVRLVREEGRGYSDVARSLGVTSWTVRAWVKQSEIEAGQREGLTMGERAEVRELRKRVRQLEMEKDILKKAAVFFAHETHQGGTP